MDGTRPWLFPETIPASTVSILYPFGRDVDSIKSLLPGFSHTSVRNRAFTTERFYQETRLPISRRFCGDLMISHSFSTFGGVHCTLRMVLNAFEMICGLKTHQKWSTKSITRNSLIPGKPPCILGDNL